jgi:signal transduction histidine kinase
LPFCFCKIILKTVTKTVTLTDLFDRNYKIFLFAYGLVFLVLGLAIALQSRQRSRLNLARSLGWLAAFGILHGLYEWGLIFIPIQATYMDPVTINVLERLHVIMLGLSFWALFHFGADLVRDRWPRLSLVPLLLAGVWATFLLVGALMAEDSPGTQLQESAVWARYLLALPGALLAAYGLHHQARQQIAQLGLKNINNMVRAAGIALVLYAFFAGLIVPYSTFFPANWLNDSLLGRTIGVPIPVFRSLVGLVLTIAIVRAMEVFEVETDRLIEHMEIEQTLTAERERIGRELHDGALQRVYTAGLIVESARRKVDNESLVAERLDRAITAMNEAIASLRTYMSDLRAVPAAVSFTTALQKQVADPGIASLVDVQLRMNLAKEPSLNPAQTEHFLAIVGEALANVARHAQATQVQVDVNCDNGSLQLNIADDGIGFACPKEKQGYGLRNIRDRARLLGGELRIESKADQGTSVILSIPLENHLENQ